MPTEPILVLAAQYAAVLMFAAALLFAAINDILRFRIPNWLCLAVLMLFAVFGLVAGMGMGEFGLRLALGAGVFVAGFVLHALGYLGGGDAKLLAANAPWMGWPGLMDFLLLVALFGGLLALIFAIVRHGALVFPQWLMDRSWFSRLLERGRGVPYGVAICAGGLLMIGSQFEVMGK